MATLEDMVVVARAIVDRSTIRLTESPWTVQFLHPGISSFIYYDKSGTLNFYYVMRLLYEIRELSLVSVTSDGRRFMDIERLFQDCIFFTVAAQVELSPDVHNAHLIKTPLQASVRFGKVSEKSCILDIRMTKEGLQTPLMKMLVKTVCIDPLKRKSKHVPEWFVDLMKGKGGMEGQTFVLPPHDKPKGAYLYKAYAVCSDTDFLGHITHVSYTRFVLNAIQSAAKVNAVPTELANGCIKTAKMSNFRESFENCTLNVYVWQAGGSLLRSSVEDENGTMLVQTSFEYYPTQSKI